MLLRYAGIAVLRVLVTELLLRIFRKTLGLLSWTSALFGLSALPPSPAHPKIYLI